MNGACIFCGCYYSHKRECPVDRYLGHPSQDELDDRVFEVCPACKGDRGGCTLCWDEGVVEHTHHIQEEGMGI